MLQSKGLHGVCQVVGEAQAPFGGLTSKLQEPLISVRQDKQSRTGAIKPHAIRIEEGKA